jgi:hypothetical protein
MRRRLLVVALSLAVVGLAAMPAVASAIVPVINPWHVVSEHDGANLDEASAVRDGAGRLHIVYKDVVPGVGAGIRYRTMSAAGVLSTPETVVGPWNGFSNPDIELVAGVPTVFFTGLYNTDSANPWNSGQSWSTSRAGGTWSAPAAMSNSHTPYSSNQVSSAVDASGTPWSSSTTTFDVLVHTGFATSGAEANYRPTNGCCGYASNLGVAADGSVYLAYYSNATDQGGYWMQQLAPTVGAATRLPQGAGPARSSSRMPMAARTTGGGLYTAYCESVCGALRIAALGRPSLRLALTPAQVPLSAEEVWLAAAPAGRLWLTWQSREGVFVTRTNKAVTKFEPVQKLTLPARTDTPWSLSGEGSRGPLDLLSNIGVNDASYQSHILIRHRRVLPRLSVVTPFIVHSDMTRTIALRLTDAGDPVVGTLRFRGVSRTTNALGFASFTVPAGTPTGFYPVTGNAVGYTAGAGRVRVHRM